MKVIHIPFCFAPDPMGGTEVYVANLARDLRALGVDSIVAAPSETSRAYIVDGLRVRRYAVSTKISDVSELYGPLDTVAAAEFAKILDEEAPDFVHFHAYTAGVSLRLVRAAKSRRIPVVFTYHTPTVSCQRGTLMLWGKTVCDGKLEIARCAGCTLEGLGMNRSLAAGVGHLPGELGQSIGKLGLQGGIWTALRMSDLIRMRHAALREMTAEVNHLVTVCDWAKEVLLLNGVAAAKVTVSRPGINWMSAEPNLLARSSTDTTDQTRFAFLGRLDPTKGVHVLIEALRAAPKLKARLDIYGIVHDSSNVAYREKMLTLAGRDARVTLHEPVASQEVVPLLRTYDVLAIPSPGLESSPLVVLEAFAAGIPVIGWNIGGVRELIQDGINGLLIEPASAEGWTQALQRFAQDAGLRTRLRAGVRPPRTSFEVAREMFGLYESVRAGEQREA
jgi:glycosyltransferase involved in cell wall biosynthesis